MSALQAAQAARQPNALSLALSNLPCLGFQALAPWSRLCREPPGRARSFWTVKVRVSSNACRRCFVAPPGQLLSDQSGSKLPALQTLRAPFIARRLGTREKSFSFMGWGRKTHNSSVSFSLSRAWRSGGWRAKAAGVVEASTDSRPTAWRHGLDRGIAATVGTYAIYTSG
jgi:hypothetical protein